MPTRTMTMINQGAKPISVADATRAVVEEFLATRLAGDTERLVELFADEVDWMLAENPAAPWIRQTIHDAGDGSVAGTYHWLAEDLVSVEIIRKESRCTETGRPDCGDVGGEPLRLVSGVVIEKRNAAALADGETAVPEGEGKIPGVAWRGLVADDVNESRAEGGH